MDLKMTSKAIQTWHDIMASKKVELLDDLLSDSVTFHSPVVHTPQEGKAITKMYLSAAALTLGNDDFNYIREISDKNVTVLEFETVIEGIKVNGIDMISWGDDDRITEFKVMLRPLKGINIVHKVMGEQLMKMSKE